MGSLDHKYAKNVVFIGHLKNPLSFGKKYLSLDHKEIAISSRTPKICFILKV